VACAEVAALVLIVDVIVTVAVDRRRTERPGQAGRGGSGRAKLTASIAVGGGGLFTLYLVARRQRTQELELAQRERVQDHAELVAETNRVHAEKVPEHTAQVAEANRVDAERVAADNRVDAAARRVTELFAKSVEQPVGCQNSALGR